MIKKIIINLILILLISVLIHLKYINIIGIKNVIPDIFFLLIFLNGIFIDPIFAMIFGFFAGLSKDIFGINLIGIYSLIYVIIGYLTFIPKKIVEFDNFFVSSITIIIFFLIKTLIYLIISSLFLELKEIAIYLKEIFIIELLYTTIASIPFFYIYNKIFKTKKKKYIEI